MYNRIFFVFLLCVSALQAGVVYHDCGSQVGHFTSISVSNCDESQTSCLLKKGTNATIGITFDINKDVTDVKAVVHGVLSGVPVPFPISHPDACADKDSGITCPLSTTDGPYTYTATFFIEKQYPRLALKVKWELKNEAGEDIVCIEIPAKIQ